jgi:hypothetical protein
VDIAHMILQGLVDHIEVSALEKYNDQWLATSHRCLPRPGQW